MKIEFMVFISKQYISSVLNYFLQVSHLILLVSVGKLIEDFMTGLRLMVIVIQMLLSSDSSGQVQVLLHNGRSVGVNRAKVSVLEESHEVSLSSLLDGKQGLRLESELAVNALTDVSHQSLEGGLEEEHSSLFLVALDLSKGYGSGSPSDGSLFFDSSLSWGTLLLLGRFGLGRG